MHCREVAEVFGTGFTSGFASDFVSIFSSVSVASETVPPVGGAHTLQAVYPLAIAFFKVIGVLLLHKYPQVHSWYFFPVRVIHTVSCCAVSCFACPAAQACSKSRKKNMSHEN
jgi:hypothetical protein